MTILEKYGTVREQDLNRPMTHLQDDLAAVRAIAQAAVDVELFTIPLYMVSLYSIQGMHQITGANAFYEGRVWPGRAPEVDAKSSNACAFNLTFKGDTLIQNGIEQVESAGVNRVNIEKYVKIRKQ